MSGNATAVMDKADIALLAALEPEVKDALIAVQYAADHASVADEQAAAARANEAVELAAQRNPVALVWAAQRSRSGQAPTTTGGLSLSDF